MGGKTSIAMVVAILCFLINEKKKLFLCASTKSVAHCIA